MGKPIR